MYKFLYTCLRFHSKSKIKKWKEILQNNRNLNHLNNHLMVCEEQQSPWSASLEIWGEKPISSDLHVDFQTVTKTCMQIFSRVIMIVFITEVGYISYELLFFNGIITLCNLLGLQLITFILIVTNLGRTKTNQRLRFYKKTQTKTIKQYVSGENFIQRQFTLCSFATRLCFYLIFLLSTGMSLIRTPIYLVT